MGTTKRCTTLTDPSDSDEANNEISRHKIHNKKHQLLRRNKKELRVQKLSHVHAKHGYTPIQYTLWAEMIGASTNNSEDESPILFQCSLAKQKTKEDR